MTAEPYSLRDKTGIALLLGSVAIILAISLAPSKRTAASVPIPRSDAQAVAINQAFFAAQLQAEAKAKLDIELRIRGLKPEAPRSTPINLPKYEAKTELSVIPVAQGNVPPKNELRSDPINLPQPRFDPSQKIHETTVRTMSGTRVYRYEEVGPGKWTFLGEVLSSEPSYGGSLGSESGRYYDPTYRPPVGEHYVPGYTRKDGTFVQSHYKTNSDKSFWNNWSSKGNYNPHTGGLGTKLPPIGRR